MANVKNTNIRFNLDKPIFKTAWDYLQGRNKTEFSSASLLIATAINEFYERRLSNSDGSFFENYNCEEKIIEAVKIAFEKYLPAYLENIPRSHSAQVVETIPENHTGESADDDLIDYHFLGG